jgi:DNA repair protein RecN (Recombination protein N)
MLVSLTIRHFVIVDALELDFAPGFTVLTGETGAGKSILIDALLLALGERAEADIVREGAARADIAAEFRPPPAAVAWLQQNDLTADAADLLLVRRTVDASGRSRAFINGAAVTLAQLRELGEQLIDVHGQQEHQSLLRPVAQLALLDEHGALAAERAVVEQSFAAWQSARRVREQAETMAASAQAEHERLRWIVDELGTVAPTAGEWTQVEEEHRRLSHAASLLEGARGAVDSLGDADAAASALVAAAAARLMQLSAYDSRLAPIAELLQGAQAQIDDAVSALQKYVDRSDLDASRLAEVETRVSTLHSAARRFRVEPDALEPLLAESRDRLAALSAASDLDALRTREATAQRAYDAAAKELSKKRAAAAKQMSAKVTRAMQDLAMAGGRFDVQLNAGEPSARGNERAEFLVAAHPGVAAKPLTRVASGGELARISLAIAVITAAATPVPTLIFDEVDAGIGGAVAETVGRLLKQLGQSRQVLCVTHLPQVAARGDQHYAVSKTTDNDRRPLSSMERLERRERVEELARMLGGQAITETTRKHARELLAG